MDFGSENRLEVLTYSLILEMEASFSLAYLLDIDIKELATSKSLGNSSSSLCFSQKINLLLDNKSVTKDERQKLLAFMNIRNQFIHNWHANTYEKCAQNIDGLVNYLTKIYPEIFKHQEPESAIRESVSRLFNDNLATLHEFKGGKANKLSKESERDVFKKRCIALEEAVESEITSLSNFLESDSGNNTSLKNAIIKIRNMKYDIRLKMHQIIIQEDTKK